MATQFKINGISFDLEQVSKMKDIKELKSQEAAAHLPEADRVYSEVWKAAKEFKPAEAELSIEKKG